MPERFWRDVRRPFVAVTIGAALAVGATAVQAQSAADASRPRYTKADVAFMQGMIAHHHQAIVMGDLVSSRTRQTPLRMLAERITVSQRDEIRLMRLWLLDHHADAPDPLAPAGHQHGGADSALMPGMLTPAEFARLETAKGAEFERRFLEGMIRHHEGALTMVAALFATTGAGQDVDIFRFASDVEADQRAEIARMRLLLKPLKETP